MITKRFNENRGLALEVAFAGNATGGGTAVTICPNYVVHNYGFRAGYLAMVVPIVAIVILLSISLVSTPSDTQVSSAVLSTVG